MEKQDFKFPVVLSHGSRTQACIDEMEKTIKAGGVVINHPDYIRIASDKYLCKRRMYELGVNTTPFQFLVDECRLNFPVVAKLRHGSGGDGMMLLNTKEELDSFKEKLTKSEISQYFIEEMFNPRSNIKNHIMTTREYRIHFSPMLMGVKVDYVDKVEQPDGSTVSEKHTSVNGVIFEVKKLMRDNQEFKFGKNISTGNAYFSRKTELSKISELYSLALEDIATLVKSLNLDYAAVDLLICPEKKSWCILEVNTAPGFGDEPGITADRYITALPLIIKTKHKLCAE